MFDGLDGLRQCVDSLEQKMHQRLGLDELKFNTKEVLKKLETNRTKHEKDYKEAKESFVVVVQNKAKELAKAAKNLTSYDKLSSFVQSLEVDVPRSHVSDYDRAIAMLEFCKNDEVVLTQTTFEQLILDQWVWSASLSASNFHLNEVAATYSVKAKKKKKTKE